MVSWGADDVIRRDRRAAVGCIASRSDRIRKPYVIGALKQHVNDVTELKTGEGEITFASAAVVGVRGRWDCVLGAVFGETTQPTGRVSQTHGRVRKIIQPDFFTYLLWMCQSDVILQTISVVEVDYFLDCVRTISLQRAHELRRFVGQNNLTWLVNLPCCFSRIPLWRHSLVSTSVWCLQQRNQWRQKGNCQCSGPCIPPVGCPPRRGLSYCLSVLRLWAHNSWALKRI